MSNDRCVIVFQYRLIPWDACLHVNFANEPLSPEFVAACTRDQLTLLTTAEGRVPLPIVNRSHQLAQRFLDAHAFYCVPHDRLLDHEPTSWLRVGGVERADTELGYMHRSLVSLQLNHEHEDNVPLHEAAALVREWGSHPPLALALMDFRSARKEAGSYYAFHAFRVLEDIRDAFPGEDRKRRWDTMNEALGTTRETWAELTDASKRARHLHPDNIMWLADTDRHARLLTLMRQTLRQFIAHLPVLTRAIT